MKLAAQIKSYDDGIPVPGYANSFSDNVEFQQMLRDTAFRYLGKYMKYF